MKKVVIATLIISLIMIVAVAIFLSNPLRKSNDQIRESVLEITPLGTNMEDVLKVIETKKKWKVVWINNDYKHEFTDLSGDFVIGTTSIKASIGKYRNFFEVDVQVYWGFDENSKLIEVEVRKD